MGEGIDIYRYIHRNHMLLYSTRIIKLQQLFCWCIYSYSVARQHMGIQLVYLSGLMYGWFWGALSFAKFSAISSQPYPKIESFKTKKGCRGQEDFNPPADTRCRLSRGSGTTMCSYCCPTKP